MLYYILISLAIMLIEGLVIAILIMFLAKKGQSAISKANARAVELERIKTEIYENREVLNEKINKSRNVSDVISILDELSNNVNSNKAH